MLVLPDRMLIRMHQQPMLPRQLWSLHPRPYTLLMLLWPLVYHSMFVGLCNPDTFGSTLQSDCRCLIAYVSTEDLKIYGGLAMVQPQCFHNTRWLPACSVSGRNLLRRQMTVCHAF